MKKLHYIGYLRKSTEDEERQVLSKDAQKAKIKATFPDLKITFLDESKSAFKPYQRPVFQEVMDMLDRGQADGIVAWHPDRLSRNEVDASAITWRIRQGLIKDLRFASFSFDNSPEGIMMLQMTMSQSQYFSAKLSKDVKRGIESKLKTGQVSGAAPAGYINKQDNHRKWIEPDPVRFPLIRKAFDMYLTGNYSVPQVLDALNDWGYTSIQKRKLGGKPLHRSGMYCILQNPRYAGRIPNPYNEGEFFEGKYTPMLTVEEYDKVQRLLGDKGKPRICASKQFALKGFIVCGECGCMITAETKYKKLVSGDVNEHTYYHCTRKRPCSQRINVKENDLFDQVTELLDGYELTPKLYEWGMEALAEMAKNEISERDNVQLMQFDSVDKVQKQLDRLLDMATSGIISNDEYKVKSKALKQTLRERQDEQIATTERVKNWYEFIGNTLDKLTNANEKFVTGDFGDKKDILLSIGQNPVLLNGKLEITPNEWLLPVKNNLESIKHQIDMVRTKNNRLDGKALLDKESSIKSTWYGIIAEVRTLLLPSYNQV